MSNAMRVCGEFGSQEGDVIVSAKVISGYENLQNAKPSLPPSGE